MMCCYDHALLLCCCCQFQDEYRAIGIDAVLLMQHADLPVSAADIPTVKVNEDNLQQVLDGVVKEGLSIVSAVLMYQHALQTSQQRALQPVWSVEATRKAIATASVRCENFAIACASELITVVFACSSGSLAKWCCSSRP